MTAPKPTARELQIAAGTYCFSGAYENDGEDAEHVADLLAEYRGELLREFEALIPALSRHPEPDVAREYNQRLLKTLIAKLRER